jgi:hypothetical protein
MVIARLLSLALFAAAAWQAFQMTVVNVGHTTNRTVAERLEAGRSLEPAYLAARASDVLAATDRAGCRSGILRPGLSVVLHNAAATNQARDYDGWVKAHTIAQDYLAAMARCLPSDGNLWLREALVDRAIAEDPADLVRRMALATRLAPSEDHQILARIHFWKTASPQTLAAGQALASQDLRVALTHGSDAVRKDVQASMSPEFESLWRIEVARSGLHSGH